jgi:hypothetical protein
VASGTDTRFSLPAVDDPASTETGVILMGLDAGQLLAGHGLAALAEDPTAVALLVDQVRHADEIRLTLRQLVALGARRWRAERDSGQKAPAVPAAPLRLAWTQAYQAILDRKTGAPATLAYLTACWLRAAELDRLTASGDGL